MATHSEINSGRDAPVIWGSLWAAAWFVLLIACANLANLTLVRTVGRWREFSTRIALGAGQARLMRQILVESLMLAGIAGTFGWWITNWSVRAWAAVTASRYQVLDYTVDSGTLAYLVAISVAAALLVFLRADRQGPAVWRERRAERRCPRRHAGPAQQTPGGRTGGVARWRWPSCCSRGPVSWCGVS